MRKIMSFPPQAMFVDFGMAAHYGGVCYLRFDDTNPEAEKLEYIEHIQVKAYDLSVSGSLSDDRSHPGDDTT